MRRMVSTFIALLFLIAAPAVARAADPAAGGDGGGDGKMTPYADFTKSAQAQHGLFTIWRKEGKLFIEAAPAQLDTDFIQTAVPHNGIGGYFLFNGSTDLAPARLIRFSRVDDKIAISWPNTLFTAAPGSPAALAVSQTFAPSLVDLAPVVSTDPATGDVVFDASPFLGDIVDMSTALKNGLGIQSPEHGYRLDSQRSFFGPTKAFPDNVIIQVDQTFASDSPNVVDNVPDPRSLEIKVDYNIAKAPDNSDYMPRLADDRVGYFDNTHLDFSNDNARSRAIRYIIRWNVQPSDPSKPMSPSKHPLVFYISSTVPVGYRAAVRDALLTWNKAFAPLGISDAVQVKDQPDPSVDPTWDSDDIRYNVVRWLTESNGGGFAEAQLIYDPRTGQEFHTGIVIDSDLMLFGGLQYPFIVQPNVARSKTFSGAEALYAEGMRREAGFGIEALQAIGLMAGYQVPEQFKYDFLKSIVLHESGHDLGLQHNFIGSEAYTPKQLQSKAFTSKYGTTASVMEYSPMNLWPKGYSQGDFWQTVLGPYDYYVVHWGYARIPGARIPLDEKPTLNRWASVWSDPRYRFASDEDVAWASAHAVDPRVNHWDLSNDTLGWCDTRLKLANGLFDSLNARYPRPGEPFDEERDAFGFAMGEYLTCAVMPEHFIGGEFLSRAHQGDPHAATPLSGVSRAEEQRAFAMLDRYIFGDSAWHFPAALLNRMTYTEWSPFWENGQWAYNPTDRHDVDIVELAEGVQNRELATMFQPLMLQRLDDLSTKARPGQTMSLADLFSWTQASIFGDLRGRPTASIALIHRSEQQSYVNLLSSLLLTPAKGTPYDAQALARSELTSLQGNLQSALASSNLDAMTRAHLEDLQVRVSRTLDARTVVPAGD
jgi:uncharacterized protein DUF4953/uncharacterized protein DUF5117